MNEAGGRATYLVMYLKPDGEPGTGLRHTASEVVLKMPGETPCKKTARSFQQGLLFFAQQSIRRNRCVVKYLSYLIYYFYEPKIYLL
jgi:hypothetical protein